MFSNFSGYNSWHREQQHSQPARTSQVSMTKHRLKEKDFPNPWQYLRLQTLSQTQVLLALRSPRWKQQASHFGRCLPRNRPSLRYKPAGPISHCSLSLSLPPISHFMSFTFSSITSFHYTHASPLSSPLFKNDFFNPLSIYSWHRIRWQMKWTTDWRWHLWIFSWQKHVSLLKLGFEGVGRLWREVWWDHTGWARDELCRDGQGGRWSNPVRNFDFFCGRSVSWWRWPWPGTASSPPPSLATYPADPSWLCDISKQLQKTSAIKRLKHSQQSTICIL